MVPGLTEKGDIRRDEGLPEPFQRDKVRDFFERNFFFFSFLFPFIGTFIFGLGHDMLDWG